MQGHTKKDSQVRKTNRLTNPLLRIQLEFLQALDSNDNRAVRLFTMDFSKAFEKCQAQLINREINTESLKPIHCQLVRQLRV